MPCGVGSSASRSANSPIQVVPTIAASGSVLRGDRGGELVVRGVPRDRGDLHLDARVGLLELLRQLGQVLALGAHRPDGQVAGRRPARRRWWSAAARRSAVSADRPQPANASAVAVSAALPITSRRRMLWVNICCLLTVLLRCSCLLPPVRCRSCPAAQVLLPVRRCAPGYVPRSPARAAAARPAAPTRPSAAAQSSTPATRTEPPSRHPTRSRQSPPARRPRRRERLQRRQRKLVVGTDQPIRPFFCELVVACSNFSATAAPASSVSGTRSASAPASPAEFVAPPRNPAYRSETSYELAGSPTNSRLSRRARAAWWSGAQRWRRSRSGPSRTR